MQIFDSVASVGKVVLIVGIIVQALSYVLFTAIIIRSVFKWSIPIDTSLRIACKKLYKLMLFGSGCILVCGRTYGCQRSLTSKTLFLSFTLD